MAPTLLRAALPLLLVGAAALPPSHGMAAPLAPAVRAHSAVVPIANWRCPYCNIDRRVDAGNDTGDAMVERLNQEQLNRGPMMSPRAYRYGRPGYPPPGYPQYGYGPGY
jgi:hypothetical protein